MAESFLFIFDLNPPSTLLSVSPLPLLGIPRSNIFWKMRIDNCSVSAAGVDKNGRATLSFLNDTLHMRIPEDKIADLPLA